MFENISKGLGTVFDQLNRRGALSEDDVRTALREVRIALLDADVALPVARSFVRSVQRAATGQAVTRSVTPGQQVVKIVHDHLVQLLAGDDDGQEPGALRIDNPPAGIMMVGLQGSGKTTTAAKLANRLSIRRNKRVLLASLDIYRPAAIDQLAILGQRVSVDTLPAGSGEDAVRIARRARQQAMLGGYDVFILDTAGRLQIDDTLMKEAADVHAEVSPRETLLVVDGLTGQVALEVAQEFDARLGISGVIMTRMDGDGRGGAAMSMRAVTGKPIRFLSTGEGTDALEDFDPKRIAGRILGMGDIVSLVEKAQEVFVAERAERMMQRLEKGRFTMNDLKQQLRQMQGMGGMGSVLSMLPGAAKMSRQIEAAGLDDRLLKQQIALIDSMTRRERASPQILQASRKRRIAAGAGLEVTDVNRLLKMHRQMSDVIKRMGRQGKGRAFRQAMQGMLGMGVGGGGDASVGDPGALAQAAAQASGLTLPPGFARK